MSLFQVQVQSGRWTRYSDKFNVNDEFCQIGFLYWGFFVTASVKFVAGNSVSLSELHRWALSSIEKKKYCCCVFHFCISEFCSGSCQRERKTLNIAACEPWFLPFSALRSKNSYSLYFVRSCLAVLICHIISASVSNESSSQTVHDQILFFCFFCSLFLVSQMVNLFSIGASVI